MEPIALKIGTFNIRTTAVGSTGRLRWNRRRRIVESLIQRENPDILALQEVANRTHGIPHDIDQHQWLSKTFPELETVVGTVANERPSDNPILARSGRFRTLHRGYLAFSGDGSVKSGGISPQALRGEVQIQIRRRQAARHIRESFATWALLEDVEGQQTIAVYNLHLDARSPSLRRRSVELVIRTIEHLGHTEVPLVVLGDFNSFRGSPPERALTGLGLEPVIGANRRGTYHFGLGVTLWPRIDHVLVSQKLRVLDGYIERHNHEGVYPSDHYPVFAEVAQHTADSPADSSED